MLNFFRKYQKIFFIVIVFFIVITFSFFGTHSVISDIKKTKDIDISKAIDGSKIKLLDVESMSYFLLSDRYDEYQRQSDVRPNVFNDGILKTDIISSGVFKNFLENYFDVLKPTFEKKLDKIKRYKLFVHSKDSSISLKNFFENFDPEMNLLLTKVQSFSEINLDFLNAYTELYLKQLNFSPASAQRYLYFQERQKNLEQDSRLYQNSLAIFGFNSVIDWFGKDLIDLVSQFIINTSVFAKEKGYKVTFEEARYDVLKNFKDFFKSQKQDYSPEMYKKMLSFLNLDEKTLVTTWQKIMLFRKYFNDTSKLTQIDNLALNSFLNFSNKKAKIDLYKLPKFLQINNFKELKLFELYLMMTTNKANPLDVPNSFKAISEIESKYPEILEKKYVVNLKHTNLEKASLKVKLKDMVAWQLDIDNWNKLKSKFNFLKDESKNEAFSSSEKLSILDNLSMQDKLVLDNYSRMQMVKENPYLIDESLKEQKFKEQVFLVNEYLALPIFFKNEKDFLKLLDEKDKISKYSQDSNNYYEFEVVKRFNEKNIISFEKALKEKILDKLLDKYLKEKYISLKDDVSSFRDNDGNYKAFDEIKSTLSEHVFSPVIKQLKALKVSKDTSLDTISKYRFYTFFEDILKNLQKDHDYLVRLNSPFKPLKETLEVSRSKNPTNLEKKVFSMEEKNFSGINLMENNLEFFYLDSFKTLDKLDQKVGITKTAIYSETSDILTKRLLKVFMDKKCIVIPVLSEKK